MTASMSAGVAGTTDKLRSSRLMTDHNLRGGRGVLYEIALADTRGAIRKAIRYQPNGRVPCTVLDRNEFADTMKLEVDRVGRAIATCCGGAARFLWRWLKSTYGPEAIKAERLRGWHGV